MKTALALTAAAIATGCGQTGALYLPDQGVETPVEIRAPAPQDEPDEEKKDVKATQPQGR